MTNSNSKKVIVGLGQTGLSCARFLAGRKESFTVVDSRQSPPGLEELQALYPQIPVELGEFNEQTFMGADELIVSPGVDLRISVIQKAIANGVRIRGDVDLFARQVKQPLVAVTGSNAKSTVVTLVGEMARQSGVNVAVAGNIGTPVLDLLNGGDEDIYVLELSSFQLETTTTLGAEVATVLNMSADHLDRYESMQAYHRAKHRIFQGCKQVVINRDDALSAPLLPPHVKRWSFGLSVPDFNEFGLLSVGDRQHLALHTRALMPVADMKIAGRHNIANALAALALGHAVGLPMTGMIKALQNFTGLAHRCQWVAEIGGVSYYNDSKGTNVGACIAALEGLADKGRIILLAGGVGKGADFTSLAAPLRKAAKLAVLFGQDSEKIAAAITGSVDCKLAVDLREAVTIARKQAESGDVVLLSPACASFDMFRNYEQRGEQFTNIVRELH